MDRRVVSLTLLLSLLLTQWVVACRCTGGCRAAGYDAKPHAHVKKLILEKTASRCCFQHYEHHSVPATKSDGVAEWLVISAESPAQDDDGVIYLSSSVVFGLWPKAVVDDAELYPDFVQPAYGESSPSHVAHELAFSTHCPPQRRASPRPLYILSLTLLI